MSKLVIVESPNKVEVIKKFLGSEYVVMASFGHIVKLPSSGQHHFGIDLKTWEPKYKIDPKKNKYIKDLKKGVATASNVLIATDPDREGEAIADNLVEFLKIQNNYQRIRFNEITKEAIINAISNPTKIDEKLVQSQKARRILDRIIGYKLSNLLRKKIYNSLTSPSAGRVQSIALKLIIEKEKEIEKFIPIKYSTIEAIINDNITAIFFYKNKKMQKKEWIKPEDVDKIYQELSNSLKVLEIKITKKTEARQTPFKQAILFKRANSILNMSSIIVQSIGQKLYENGIISYPRTDSTRLSKSFISKAQIFLENKYGKKYVANEIKGIPGAQDAHEAIRPTNLELTPLQAQIKFKLNDKEFKLYELIYNNICQSLMLPPQKEILRYELINGQHLFKMSFSKVIFEGYYKVIGYDQFKNIPKFVKDEIIPIIKYIKKAQETKPPARYNEGSLIEKLDNIGVGRPSTFALTIQILKNRTYTNKEGKVLHPTEFGKVVISKLLDVFPNIINEEYTSKMEIELDEIAIGKYEYKKLLNNFWIKFIATLSIANEKLKVTRLMPIFVGKKCPKCNNDLVLRLNKKTGNKFFGCSKFPKCKHAESDPSQKRTWNKKWTNAKTKKE